MQSARNSRAAAGAPGSAASATVPLIALTGKLLPLFALFFALLGIEALTLHAGFEPAYRGNVLMMVVAAMLFIVAYQSLAALLPLLVRDLALSSR